MDSNEVFASTDLNALDRAIMAEDDGKPAPSFKERPLVTSPDALEFKAGRCPLCGGLFDWGGRTRELAHLADFHNVVPSGPRLKRAARRKVGKARISRLGKPSKRTPPSRKSRTR